MDKHCGTRAVDVSATRMVSGFGIFLLLYHFWLLWLHTHTYAFMHAPHACTHTNLCGKRKFGRIKIKMCQGACCGDNMTGVSRCMLHICILCRFRWWHAQRASRGDHHGGGAERTEQDPQPYEGTHAAHTTGRWPQEEPGGHFGHHWGITRLDLFCCFVE